MHIRDCSVLCATLLAIASSKPTCGPQKYYDPVVRRCSPCTNICLNADLQGTSGQCARECPGFESQGRIGMLNDGVSGKNDSSGLNLAAAITSPIAVLLAILIIVGLIILKKKELGDLVKRFQDRCTRSTDDIGDTQQDTELKVFAGTDNELENPEAIPLNVDGMLEINNQRCPVMVAVSDHIVHDRQEHGPYRPAF